MSSGQSTDDAHKATPCRNILIHGYCKYADKGCVFMHDAPESSALKSAYGKGAAAGTGAGSPGPAAEASLQSDPDAAGPRDSPASSAGARKAKKKVKEAILFKPSETPIFTPTPPPSESPTGSFLAGPPQFKPSEQFAVLDDPAGGNPARLGGASSAAPFVPGFSGSNGFAPADGADFQYNGSPSQQYGDFPSSFSDLNVAGRDPSQPPPPPHPSHHNLQPQTGHNPLKALQYHMYAPPTPRKKEMTANERTVDEFFIPSNIRETLQKKNAARLGVNGTNIPVPEFVSGYHTLVPLDTAQPLASFGGYRVWTYKATNINDGVAYCLQRVEGLRITDEYAIGLVKFWESVTGPAVVKVHEAFTTRDFGDNSVIFVYDFHPLSKTLMEAHFGQRTFKVATARGVPVISEQVIWSYTCQLATAIKTIHAKGMTTKGVIDLKHILLTGKSRVRLNRLGMMDVISYRPDGSNAVGSKAQDLKKLGEVLLTLACNTLAATQNVSESLDYVQRVYSESFTNVLRMLLSEGATIEEVITACADGMANSLTYALSQADKQEEILSGELENGRLVRLLCKFGFINERPEYENDHRWSETGDKYVIKLFRDYVFHQVDENGKPVIDLGHVLTCLNKLDVGLDENILLVSRDEQTCVVTSYKDIKGMIWGAFRELGKWRD